MMRTTADDLVSAIDTMDRRIEKWEKEHPNEKMAECPKCGNRGLIKRCFNEYGHEVFGEDKLKPGIYDYFEPCQCVKGGISKTVMANRKFATVPGLYTDATFDNFRTDIYSNVNSRQLIHVAKSEAMKYVINFDKMQQNGMGLYIFSRARGSGKSRLASTISNELINVGVRNKYASASGILSEIQRTWNEKSMSETKIIENYVEPKVLIIDDLGARSGQSWMDEKFLMIIDNRYQNNKVTIYTSNYEVGDLPFKDMRIIDRLSDVDRFHKIRMPDETVRVKSRSVDGKKDLFNELINGGTK